MPAANSKLQTHKGSAETDSDFGIGDTLTVLQTHKGSAETALAVPKGARVRVLQTHKGSAETRRLRQWTRHSDRFKPTRVLLKLL